MYNFKINRHLSLVLINKNHNIHKAINFSSGFQTQILSPKNLKKNYTCFICIYISISLTNKIICAKNNTMIWVFSQSRKYIK